MANGAEFKLDFSETFPHFPNAPIVEAVIHWSARATTWFEQEQLRERLAALLPDYPKCGPITQLVNETEISWTDPPEQSPSSGWRGFKLASEDGRNVFEFSRVGVIFSRLQPYESWDKFASEAIRIWDVYQDLCAPAEVHRLEVRFINVVASVPNVAALADLLTQPPTCLESVKLPLNSFLYQALHDVPGWPYRVNVVRTTLREQLQPFEPFPLVIDIDVATTSSISTSRTILNEHLANMRWLKNKAFTTLVTDQAMQMFSKHPEGEQ